MKKILLCILDGFGLKDDSYGNAISKAYKPNFEYLMNTYPHALLEASGESVGLPSGQMGNSEVGHTNIGAGRIVYQPLELINRSIKDGSFFKNEQLLNAIKHAKENSSKLHIYGLLSDGGVHSHIEHILAILDLCKQENFTNVYIHAFTDGRDTLPDVCSKYFEILEAKLNEIGFGTLATISGRYYAMDRDKRWDRLKKAYDAIVLGEGTVYKSSHEVIDTNYHSGNNDEFIEPSLLTTSGKLADNDSIIFANFRPDRATELLTSISNPNFKDMEVKRFTNVNLVTLMPCVASVIAESAFREQPLKDTLGEYLAHLSYSQLRIAETEKYAHVTYFFDGGTEKALENSKKVLIASPKEVATYDLKPEMSAYQVTDALLQEMNKNYNLIVLNYANCDMVGHTGDIKATIKAVEVVDDCLGMVMKKAKELDYTMIVIADHGNADTMLDEQGNIVTAHSLSKVPIIITDDKYNVVNGKLADVAPTILELMNLPIPFAMTGDILIRERS